MVDMIVLKLLLALFFFVEFMFLMLIDFFRKEFTNVSDETFYSILLLLITGFLLVDYFLINEVATNQFAVILDNFYKLIADISYSNFYIQFKFITIYFVYICVENYDLILEELNNSSDNKAGNQDQDPSLRVENEVVLNDKKTQSNNEVDNKENKKDLQDPVSKGFERQDNSNKVDNNNKFDDLFDI